MDAYNIIKKKVKEKISQYELYGSSCRPNLVRRSSIKYISESIMIIFISLFKETLAFK